MEYLAEVSRLAARGLAAQGPRRKFGAWLLGAVQRGQFEFVADPKIPLQAAAMILINKFSSPRFRCFGILF